MANSRPKRGDDTSELIRTLLIVQLGLAGVPQPNIRSIVGCDMNRVNDVLQLLKPKNQKKKKKQA